MRIRDEKRETEFYTDDKAIIAKAKKDGSGYSIVSEETPEEARRNELSAMTRKELDDHALTLNLKPADYKLKPEIVEAIFTTERGGTVTNAPNA